MDSPSTHHVRESTPTFKPKVKTLSLPDTRIIPSDYLTIQCGGIPIDPRAHKVAILTSHDPLAGPSTLPQGDKNINEDLLPAALRLVHERTGIPCFPLPLKVPTRAMPTLNMDFPQGDDDLAVTETLLNCEASSVGYREVRITSRVEVEFWFVVRGDSSVGKTEVRDDECGRGWRVEWLDVQTAAAKLTPSHRIVLEKALEDMRRSGFAIESTMH